MKNSVKKVMMALMMLSFTMAMSAQRHQSNYDVRGNKVMYDGQLLREADAQSFQILGYGYAKDRYNVYLDGEVLRYVDPQTFRLQVNAHNGNGNNGYNGFYHGYNGTKAGYMVTKNEVFFAGRRVQGASAHTFKDLGKGYGKDAFSVYFYGEKIGGTSAASANTFKVLSDGYSKDAFNVYYYGEVVKGASAPTFKVDNHGYAHDAFSYYYNGRKLDR